MKWVMRLASSSMLYLVASVFAIVGCSGGSSDEPNDVITPGQLPELAPPEQGIQLRTRGTTIPPGEDVEFCEIVTLPGTPQDEYWVEGFDIAMTDFSHHLIVSAINSGSAAETEFADGDIVPCTGAHNLVGLTEVTDVTGSQQPRFTIDYPAGVGKTYTGGTKFIFDYHYLNTSTQPVPARHAVNFRTTAPENIQHIAQRLVFANLTIDIPAHEQASFTGECRFDKDVMVGALVRHTHRWGTDFATWYAGGAQDAEHIWTSSDWELDTTHWFDAPFLMPAGSGFRFQCDFNNTTDAPLRFGEKATDEMCILFGLWWNPDPADSVTPQFCIMSSIDADGVARGTKQLPEGF
jgi:hypothetical protein